MSSHRRDYTILTVRARTVRCGLTRKNSEEEEEEVIVSSDFDEDTVGMRGQDEEDTVG